MRLVIEREEDMTWRCETDPETWGSGFGETPEGAVDRLRVVLCSVRDSGLLRDRGWPDRHEARRALSFIEGRASIMDRLHTLGTRIARRWAE